MDAKKIGALSVTLGAGREKKEDDIDLSAGIRLNKKIGDYVKKGETIAVLHTSSAEKAAEAAKVLLDITKLSDTPQTKPPLIYKVMR